MRFTQLGGVAALAGVSQGFLIPPTITALDKDVISILPFATKGMDGRSMELDCPGCPLDRASMSESILQLNFTLSHNNGADQLLMNGLQMYPMLEPGSPDFMRSPRASQLVKMLADETWHQAKVWDLGYSMRISHPKTSNQEEMGLVALRLEIMDVAGKYRTGSPLVDVQLLETPSGKLMIGDVRTVKPKSSTSPTDGAQECTTLVCKWRAIIAEKLRTMKGALAKGCGGRKRPSAVAVPEQLHDGAEVVPVFIPKPFRNHHGHRPHGSHRGHRQHRTGYGVARFLRGIVLHVFIPVIIGIMVGITASLVGMVVGHILVFTWRMLFRRGQRNYAAVEQDEVIDEVEDESKGVLEHQGPPPQYEDNVDEKKEASA